MGTDKISEEFVKNLLLVMPDWNSKLVRPFRETLNGQMSLETYYCLETLKLRGTAAMGDLARHLKVPKQQVTKLVDKLYECGFVERVQNEQDRRVIWLRLTPEAVSYLDEYYLKNMAFIESLEERYTPEELARMTQALKVLGELLGKMGY